MYIIHSIMVIRQSILCLMIIIICLIYVWTCITFGTINYGLCTTNLIPSIICSVLFRLLEKFNNIIVC